MSSAKHQYQWDSTGNAFGYSSFVAEMEGMEKEYLNYLDDFGDFDSFDSFDAEKEFLNTPCFVTEKYDGTNPAKDDSFDFDIFRYSSFVAEMEEMEKEYLNYLDDFGDFDSFDAEKVFLNTPCFVTEKYDGTNLAKDDLEIIYSRRFALGDDEQELIKTSLKKVREAHVNLIKSTRIEIEIELKRKQKDQQEKEVKKGKYLTPFDKDIILQGIPHYQKKFDPAGYRGLSQKSLFGFAHGVFPPGERRSFRTLLRTLIQAGDIEVNPGPPVANLHFLEKYPGYPLIVQKDYFDFFITQLGDLSQSARKDAVSPMLYTEVNLRILLGLLKLFARAKGKANAKAKAKAKVWVKYLVSHWYKKVKEKEEAKNEEQDAVSTTGTQVPEETSVQRVRPVQRVLPFCTLTNEVQPARLVEYSSSEDEEEA